MAYGKIKLDTITWDNSGTDVDITVSTIPTAAQVAAKAPLASPTFTGSPTVPGYAPLASPALTGTATAVNITLSGNLVVNGTTTTIDSTNTTISDNLIELNSGASSNANDSGIIIERGSTGDNAIIAWDESADKFIVGTTTGTASSTGDITIAAGTLVTSTVEDSKGDVRQVPANTQTGSSNYDLVAADSGKAIARSGGNVRVQNSIFTTGDLVTIINNSAADITITQGSGVTIYNSADQATGDRTLAARGMATIYFTGASSAYISGAGLS